MVSIGQKIFSISCFSILILIEWFRIKFLDFRIKYRLKFTSRKRIFSVYQVQKERIQMTRLEMELQDALYLAFPKISVII